MTTKQAIRHFGSVAALAQVLGISRQSVYRWGKYPPPLRAYQLREIVAAETAA
jgi:hypothetical protein